ncbi:MAG: hypothetical protein LKK00_08995 [Intestinimonas sp.]|jgi:hypothetical protein|nr:hypothetical protein [Intestinimonas sp.]
MLDEENVVRTENEKRISAKEMVRTFLKLPVPEREKLFYMMKGVELTVEPLTERPAWILANAPSIEVWQEGGPNHAEKKNRDTAYR